MRLAYLYEYDASNPAVQSSRPFSILRELKRRFEVVEYFPVSNVSRRLLGPKKLLHAVLGAEHHLEREWLSLKEYAWRANAFLAREKPDAIFSPSQIIPTYLSSSAKLIYCNDAPFGAIANYYPNFSNLSAEYVKQGYRQEYLSHRNADHIVYPSEWARDCAVQLHRADTRKCSVQSFGANLPYEPSWAQVNEAIDRRKGRQSVVLTMISSDWERKGGPFALAIVNKLNDRGIVARLRVVGDAPPNLERVEALGRINKWTDEGAVRFRNAMFASDFVIMPSIAEAYGMSLWEGAAHGLPMIGRATGGITSIIKNGESGLLFSMDAKPDQIARWVEECLSGSAYRQFCECAFEEYRSRGNWKTFVDRVFGGG
ncbi:glycosyltransferase family 4 protein [Bradyrhizobium sp. MOS002]|uniref:glycosyltransferase family 4 protein n=1 Tax=Bradyrhizobium sp. MOS002 TaxID=2133947 RepID=UPI000D13AE76|nr:glycosyltransferase family 4 protein [Bradyrhizobium sp. MOS002]PSO25966.1 hypothetical protein C7G41_28720 [Bradyrhizobium sp. MOS002]